MAIAATYASATTLTALYDADGSKDLRDQCPVGVTIRADCGEDGTRYGVVTAISYADPVTTIILSGDPLTTNLASFEHGNDTPASLCSHATNHALTARDSLASVLAAMPAHFSRDAVLAAKTVSAAADRYALAPWQRLGVNIGDSGFYATELADIDLSQPANWDQTTTDYTVAANRAGKDFYVYGCNSGGTLKILLSANTTYPDGYDATTSRKLGGFHCLCVAVGTISGHALTGYVAGDILPASVWDLQHRPVAAPEGMVYVDGINKWVDIYLPSVSGSTLVSIYGGTIADGASSTSFHWFKFAQWFPRTKKTLLSQIEFMAAAYGSNISTAFSADPVTTGGHSDTAGRRMISNCGCEDCVGALWQWSRAVGAPAASTSWATVYTAEEDDTVKGGQMVNMSCAGLLGGAWGNDATHSGVRGFIGDQGPLVKNANCSSRGASDSM